MCETWRLETPGRLLCKQNPSLLANDLDEGNQEDDYEFDDYELFVNNNINVNSNNNEPNGSSNGMKKSSSGNNISSLPDKLNRSKEWHGDQQQRVNDFPPELMDRIEAIKRNEYRPGAYPSAPLNANSFINDVSGSSSNLER